MLKITTYTQSEMVEIFNTTRMDSIKRSLSSLGFTYEVEGRGKKALFHITGTPDEFKLFAIKELGFAPQTDFTGLKYFTYSYFCCEGFSDLMVINMVEEIENNFNYKASQQTIARYIEKFTALDLIHKSNAEFKYYSVVVSSLCGEIARDTMEIEKETFTEAWKAYWEAWRNTNTYNDAFNAMVKVAEGKVYKVNKREENAFSNELIERMVELVIGAEPQPVVTVKATTGPSNDGEFVF